MTTGKTSKPDYDARLRRAGELAAKFAFAKQILEFYQRVTEFQQELYSKISEMWGGQAVVCPSERLRSELNVVLLLSRYTEFLSLVERHAPGPLGSAARERQAKGHAAWTASLADYWAMGGRDTALGDPREQFLSRAFLEPYAELVRTRITVSPLLTTPRRCPLCEAGAMLGVLRPEGDGGKRSLVCSFCGHEWEFRRILCPSCGEEEEKKLPVYVAEEFPYIRVEACETCGFFIRTIDLTKDGRAIPIVDDLAAIPLSLWAQEQGYARLRPNLLGS
jgi:formate dehydrogenase maturation protein FdhE